MPPVTADDAEEQRPDQLGGRDRRASYQAALSITEDIGTAIGPIAACGVPPVPPLSGPPAPSCTPSPQPEPASPPRPDIQASPNLHRPNRAHRPPANSPLTCRRTKPAPSPSPGRTRKSEPSGPTAGRADQPDLNPAIPSTFRAKINAITAGIRALITPSTSLPSRAAQRSTAYVDEYLYGARSTKNGAHAASRSSAEGVFHRVTWRMPGLRDPGFELVLGSPRRRPAGGTAT